MFEVKMGGKRGFGITAIVDDADRELIEKHKWSLDSNGARPTCTWQPKPSSANSRVLM